MSALVCILVQPIAKPLIKGSRYEKESYLS
jgi:hypothetical protein